jgi:uncharacterized membrane protein YkvA (DUF1232 family)
MLLSPRRIAAFRALWRVLAAGRTPGAPTLGERARALPRLLGGSLTGRYRGLNRARLALFVLAVAYLLSPLDLLSGLLLNVFGLAGDGVVLLWLASSFLVETDRFLRWERTLLA